MCYNCQFGKNHNLYSFSKLYSNASMLSSIINNLRNLRVSTTPIQPPTYEEAVYQAQNQSPQDVSYTAPHRPNNDPLYYRPTTETFEATLSRLQRRERISPPSSICSDPILICDCGGQGCSNNHQVGRYEGPEQYNTMSTLEMLNTSGPEDILVQDNFYDEDETYTSMFPRKDFIVGMNPVKFWAISEMMEDKFSKIQRAFFDYHTFTVNFIGKRVVETYYENGLKPIKVVMKNSDFTLGEPTIYLEHYFLN